MEGELFENLLQLKGVAYAVSLLGLEEGIPTFEYPREVYQPFNEFVELFGSPRDFPPS